MAVPDRTVPSDSEANPLAPPSYRDDDDDDAQSAIALDTTIPTRAKIKRNRRKCVCCGLKYVHKLRDRCESNRWYYFSCTLFCKALGIVTLIFVVWNGFKLIRWAITVSASSTIIQQTLNLINILCLACTHRP